MSDQPRDPATGRYAQTEADRDHGTLLAALTARPSKHSALVSSIYPTAPQTPAQ